MIRLGFKEYVRNFWFNFFTVIILAFMIISSTILISTLVNQTKTYRYAKKYLGKKGSFITMTESKCIDELEDIEDFMGSQKIIIKLLDNIQIYPEAVVYDERMENYIKPILSEGKWIDDKSGNKDTIYAVISENPYGIKTGDTIKASIASNKGDQEVKVHICGKIMEGQRIYMPGGTIRSDMSIDDLFQKYSYEQLQTVLLITTTSQIEKLNVEPEITYGNVIVKYKDSISDEAFKQNQEDIYDYSILQLDGNSAAFDREMSIEKIKKQSDEEEKNIYLKYIPMISVDFILICICIMGISAVKTARSAKYYGKLFVCGMKWSGGTLLTIMEMAVNSIMAIVLSIVMLIIHNKYMMFGRIFANLGIRQVVIMTVMCFLTIAASGTMSSIVMKENAPVDILREY